MNARIKKTGEIVTLLNIYADGTARDTNGRHYHQGDISEFIEESNHSIDWEQRRYEIAKEAMGAFIASPSYQDIYSRPWSVAEIAVEYADALIEELMKGGDK